MPASCQNLINGEWCAAAGGATFEDRNPADTSDLICTFPASDPEDVDRACEAAHAALEDWRGRSGPERGSLLAKAADLLEHRLPQVAADLSREEGKTLAEARGESARAVAILRYYSQEAWRATGEVIPSASARTLFYTNRVPLGVVAAITPWNFPIAVPAWKLAPALAFGNTVVLKPAGLAPLTAANLVRALHDAGLPPGVVNLVTGSGSTVGQALVQNPRVRGVTFTGSNDVGRQVAAWAVQRNVKFQLEMGGKNPLVVAADADLDQAADLTVRGAMLSAGQKCTATSRAIVERPVLEEFARKVVDRVKALKLGPATDESAAVGPVVSEAQRRSILEYIRVGQEEGATLLVGGGVPQGAPYDAGHYVEPTVFADARPEMRIAQEEIFGPVLALLAAEDLDDALRIANGVKLGLSASICTRSLNTALYFTDRIEAGMVRVNGETAGVEPQAPFGGVKESSSHSREQGRAALEFFTEVKTIAIERSAS